MAKLGSDKGLTPMTEGSQEINYLIDLLVLNLFRFQVQGFLDEMHSEWFLSA